MKWINKRNILIVITMVLAIATSVFILIQAGLDSAKSTEQSAMGVEVIETVVDTIAPGTINETNIDDFSGAVRKIIGHFLLFSVVGFFVTWSIFLLLENIRENKKFLILSTAFLIGYGILLAAISEIMQLFASGRSGEFRDVMIDFGGYLLGAVIIFLILFFVLRKNKKAKESFEAN